MMCLIGKEEKGKKLKLGILSRGDLVRQVRLVAPTSVCGITVTELSKKIIMRRGITKEHVVPWASILSMPRLD